MPKEIAEARKLTRAQLTILLHKYLHMDRVEMDRISRDKTTPMIDLYIIAIISKGTMQGDDRRLNFLLEQTLGKLKEKVEVKGDLNVSVHDKLVEILRRDSDA